MEKSLDKFLLQKLKNVEIATANNMYKSHQYNIMYCSESII